MKKGKYRKKKMRTKKLLFVSSLILFLMVLYGIIYSCREESGADFGIFNPMFPTKKVGNVEVTEMYLTPNNYSRPPKPLKKVKGVVVHYTANPGSSAENNRNYFEGLKDSQETYASSHFIIGLDGEIIQCIPLDEISYASNDRNKDTISIECCHKKKSGEFTEATYRSLVRLLAWLCGEYNLKKNDIIRHYDITGKMCPKYYVDHEDKWIELKEDVVGYVKEFGQ